MSGKNRGELEKALKHYSKNAADSLKLRAAEFLILNMPGKHSEYYDAPWNDVAMALLHLSNSSNRQLVLDTYPLGKKVRKDDVIHITAKYLINNIELAFQAWRETPWSKDIPFAVFCEEILPYRVSTEPLENWREKALATFADLYAAFRENPDITTVEACIQLNAILPRFRHGEHFPDMCFTQLMTTTRGQSEAMTSLAIFSMRALGIPVSVDDTPQWPDNNFGHSWNSVYDTSTGQRISFMGAESNPGEMHAGILFPTSKI